LDTRSRTKPDHPLRRRSFPGGRVGEKVKAKIQVTLKPGILDPQGKAIEQALATLGYATASNVRMGKYLELDLNEKDKVKAEVEVKAMCEKLLANTIIEEYRYELS
jgi:phosphoribosylformylglycinamidine synthase subunit PurS